MYVISNDSDMKESCALSEYLISLSKLDELFDIVNNENEYVSVISHRWFIEITERIAEEFKDKIFSLEYYELESVIENIEVNSIDLSNENLIEIQDGMVIFSVEATIYYSADVSYPDPDMTHYDKEDDELYVFSRIEETIISAKDILASISIQFNRNEPHEPVIADVDIDTNGKISISPYYEKYPYD
jgi:hypothetical protein